MHSITTYGNIAFHGNGIKFHVHRNCRLLGGATHRRRTQDHADPKAGQKIDEITFFHNDFSFREHPFFSAVPNRPNRTLTGTLIFLNPAI